MNGMRALHLVVVDLDDDDDDDDGTRTNRGGGGRPPRSVAIVRLPKKWCDAKRSGGT